MVRPVTPSRFAADAAPPARPLSSCRRVSGSGPSSWRRRSRTPGVGSKMRRAGPCRERGGAWSSSSRATDAVPRAAW